MESRYAEVAVPVNVHQTFTYRLPERMAERAMPGSRVLVPFGKQLITGYIIQVHQSLQELGQESEDFEIRDVEEIIDAEPLLTSELLDLSKWIADYYYSPWGEVIKACLPAGINVEAETILSITHEGRAALAASEGRVARSSKIQALSMIADQGMIALSTLAKSLTKARASAIARELEKSGMVTLTREVQSPQVRTKRQQAVRLVLRDPGETGKPLSEPQRKIIGILSDSAEPVAYATLAEAADVSPAVIRTLEKRGYVEVFPRDVRRNPLSHLKNQDESDHADLNLTDEQQAALDQIAEKLDEKKYAAFLLHGVTGSGKTEVYLRAMRETLLKGRTALMLVPEISLTPMFARRLRAHFGDAVAILHSSLSEGERLDEWNRIRRGEARVCIGARSAIFAPLENIGLIVVDEEHEASYKQEESPRYHGRDSAIMRALRADAVIILGSATPSMESFHNAHTGKYTYLKLDERFGGRQMAAVEIVDMRKVFERHGKQQIFSDEMKDAMRENHERGEQTLVLLNRRGFSSFSLCRSCGHTSHCPNCDVTLTYHKSDARLVCHYCNHQERVPKTCPECNGPYIYYVGEGTEQIEALLKDLFPQMRVSRLDRDTTRRRGAFEKLLGEFGTGEIDLMVGTQMIAKGHDFQNVTLVCVVSVDAGLGMPDFRSAERTFQLLTQVAGRAGRGEKPGRVIIQSYHTEHYALEFARQQNYEKFYEFEINFRRNMHYPPFVALINLLIRHPEYVKAATMASDIARLVRENDAEKVLRVLGPAPAPFARLKGEYRMQVLIKTRYRRQAREALDASVLRLKDAGQDLKALTIEVDPVSLL